MQQPAPAIPSDTPRSVSIGLAKLSLVLRHHRWQERGDSGLTPTQSQILALLSARGAQRVSALSAELAISQPTVSDAVTSLEAKGHVRRVPARDDARARLVHLTAKGVRASGRAAEWPDALLTAVDALPEDDQAAFLRGLSGMIRHLQEAGAIPVARMCVTCRFFRPHVHGDPQRPHHCAFVDMPFGDRELRLDCAEHEPAQIPTSDTKEEA